jgi:hypothetical protein
MELIPIPVPEVRMYCQLVTTTNLRTSGFEIRSRKRLTLSASGKPQRQ